MGAFALSPRFRRVIVAIGAVLIVGAVGALVRPAIQRDKLATVLEIDHLPSSATNVECEGWGMTDLLVRCSFEVQPRDFPVLLVGRDFKMIGPCPTGVAPCTERSDAGMVHDYCCGPKLGENFHIETVFTAIPSDAPQGGTLTVVANAARSRGMVDLYVE